MKKLIYILLILLVAGCTMFSKKNRKHYYQIYYKPRQHENIKRNISVRIKTFSVDKIYKRYNLVYRKSPFELFYYNTHFWAAKPDDMLTDLIANHIKAASIFQEVMMKLDKRPDYVITGKIIALDQIDSIDRWFARAEMILQLQEFRSGTVIATHHFDVRKEVFTKAPVYVVRALGEIIENETEVFIQKVNEAVPAE